ncbi:hypothetical protein [Saccharopolyspora cebuensis]|uniref:DUF4239 domain-containing protein n=1 Tax=Saccharopolyspora cebuensis TaxID=418759 RepID=A0ABV4CR18_9PSEU
MSILSIVSVGLLALVVAGITLLIARRKAVADGGSDSDSQSFVGGVLNALFTVVLAFYIVFAWQNGDDIESAAKQEANALTDIYWQASVAPAPQAAAIQSLTEQYAERVVDHEWAALDESRTDPEVDRLLNALRGEVLALPADDEAVKSAREQSLQSIRQIDEGHRERVDIATDSKTFNTVLLAGSALGAALMIAFPLLVGLSMRPANIASMVLLSSTLGLVLYLSTALMHPLSGPFGIDPDPFRTTLEGFSRTTTSGA